MPSPIGCDHPMVTGDCRGNAHQLEEAPGGRSGSPAGTGIQHALKLKRVRDGAGRCRPFARWWWNLAQGHSLNLLLRATVIERAAAPAGAAICQCSLSPKAPAWMMSISRPPAHLMMRLQVAGSRDPQAERKQAMR